LDLKNLQPPLPQLAPLFENTETKNILGKYHFGHRNIEKDPQKFPLIFNFKNFGDFQKLLIRPEMHYLDAMFCFKHLKKHWIPIINYNILKKLPFGEGMF
jgi:hypothetical protein